MEEKPNMANSAWFARQRMIPILLAALVASILIGAQYTYTQAAVSPSTVNTINKWGGIQPCDYTIFTDGTTYYSKHCDSGAVAYSGTVFSTVIQNTITSGLPSGGEIVIKTGIYEVTQQINITKNAITISGEGQYLTKLRAQTVGMIMIKSGSGNNIVQFTLRDIQLLGNDKAASALSWNCAVCFGGEARLQVRNVFAWGYTGVILVILNSSIHHFQNVNAHTGTRVLDLTSVSHTWISDSDFEDTTSDAIRLIGVEETWISDTKFDLIGAYCLNVLSFDFDVYVSNSLLYHCGTGGIFVSADFSKVMLLNNVKIMQPGQAGDNLYDGIKVEGIGGTIIASNLFIFDDGVGAAAKMRYGINDAGNGNVYIGGFIAGYRTAPVNFAGTSLIVTGINGVITENKGTGTIASGSTSAWVTHAMSLTPVVAEMTVRFTEDPTNTPGATFITNVNSTHFRVNVENDPGASNLDFSWSVRRIP